MKGFNIQATHYLGAYTNSFNDDFRNMVSITRMKLGLHSFSKARSHKSKNTIKDKETIERKLLESNFVRGRFTSGYIAYVLDEEVHNCIKAVVFIKSSGDLITFNSTGDNAVLNDIFNWLEKEFPKKGTEIHTVTNVDDKGKLYYNSSYLHSDEIIKAEQCFYPFLNISLDAYFKAFMEADESILILFGPPGGGKSTFIRTLIASGSYDTTLVYNHTLVNRPEIIDKFFDNDHSRILAYEDIDKYLGTREDGNGLMSSFLNVSDGVVKNTNKKIIFSTNLPTINKIDPALMRVGRCFDILRFDYLTQEQANNISLEMKLPSRDFSSKKEWSLAEVLNPTVPGQQTINRFSQRTGF